jgi:aarF domain-containing kinase
LFITVGGGIKYTHDHFGGLVGLKRAASFYSLAIPKYLEYRYHMYADSEEHKWDKLHEDTSQLGLQKILELRAFYIKSGQMVSANMGNAFPLIWQNTMSVLQDGCPPQEFSVVKEIVEKELGKPLTEVFVSFEKEPIGAASIGQVHRATLMDGTR